MTLYQEIVALGGHHIVGHGWDKAFFPSMQAAVIFYESLCEQDWESKAPEHLRGSYIVCFRSFNPKGDLVCA